MPCRSDYLEPNKREREASKVAALLDELQDGVLNTNFFKSGTHPFVRNKKFSVDELTRVLCGKLKLLNVSNYSLEMQIWWRDHQIADKKREEKAAIEQSRKNRLKQALNKLTPSEINLIKKADYSEIKELL